MKMNSVWSTYSSPHFNMKLRQMRNVHEYKSANSQSSFEEAIPWSLHLSVSPFPRDSDAVVPEWTPFWILTLSAVVCSFVPKDVI